MATNNSVNTSLSGQTGTGSFAGSNSPTFTGIVTVPSPFTVGATSVTSTGTQLNLLNGLTVVPINKVIVQVFNSSGTYTPTTGMKYCTIEVQGGGGGSGGVTQSIAANCTLSAGGGGGGYARKTVPAATIGASQAVTVGAGGTAGANTGTNGGTGGTSSVGSIVSATGGAGGAGATVYSTAYQQNSYLGGVGSNGDVNVNGGCGSDAYATGAGAMYNSPKGGSSYFAGQTAFNGGYGAGTTGNTYGAGASGALSFGAGVATGPYAGAVGGAGIVIITEYVSA